MDNELIFWILAGIASIIASVVMFGVAKKNSENYIDWGYGK